MDGFYKYFRLMMSLLIAVILFFISATVTFSSAVANVVIFVIALFLLILNMGRIDDSNGFGKGGKRT